MLWNYWYFLTLPLTYNIEFRVFDGHIPILDGLSLLRKYYKKRKYFCFDLKVILLSFVTNRISLNLIYRAFQLTLFQCNFSISIHVTLRISIWKMFPVRIFICTMSKISSINLTLKFKKYYFKFKSIIKNKYYY